MVDDARVDDELARVLSSNQLIESPNQITPRRCARAVCGARAECGSASRSARARGVATGRRRRSPIEACCSRRTPTAGRARGRASASRERYMDRDCDRRGRYCKTDIINPLVVSRRQRLDNINKWNEKRLTIEYKAEHHIAAFQIMKEHELCLNKLSNLDKLIF